MPLFVMDIMSDMPGVPGLFVAGIFSGALRLLLIALNGISGY
jgi:solute carrier family 5 (sodium-coupled monocarboxylate transporter), member 8/12